MQLAQQVRAGAGHAMAIIARTDNLLLYRMRYTHIAHPIFNFNFDYVIRYSYTIL